MFAVAVGAQARHRRARGGMGEGIATIAPFGTHGALREGEALDAPDDRVGHADLTITRTVLARRHGGGTAGWMAGAGPGGFEGGRGPRALSPPMIPNPRLTPTGSRPAAAVPLLAAWLAPFRDGFTAAVWPR